MGSYMDNAFPAGDESDASNDEWDIGCTDKKFSQNKVGLEKKRASSFSQTGLRCRSRRTTVASILTYINRFSFYFRSQATTQNKNKINAICWQQTSCNQVVEFIYIDKCNVNCKPQCQNAQIQVYPAKKSVLYGPSAKLMS